MKFRLEANAVFEAASIDDALRRLALHLNRVRVNDKTDLIEGGTIDLKPLNTVAITPGPIVGSSSTQFNPKGGH